ncbi:MAG TPA: UDP-glucose 4-epimerase GalE, partial [Prevotellaceae bacterium]|nr:UDP-glucose 4-epimerase GalE [Prevotellaceae bacterium]
MKQPIDIFNIGTGKGNSVLELIHTFEECTGVKLNYKITGRRAGDIEQVWGNVDKANKILGWKACHTLADSLTSAWKWQLELRRRGIM